MKFYLLLLLSIPSIMHSQFGEPVFVGEFHTFDNRLKREIHTSDINNDGHLDIVLPYSLGVNGGHFRYYLNNGDTTFISESIVQYSPNDLLIGTPRMNFADFNNDGDIDILLDTTFYADDFSILMLSNNGVYDNDMYIETIESVELGTLIRTYVNDIDADGDMDIIYNLSSNISIKQNNGDATFLDREVVTEIAESDVGDAFGAIALADMNNDGFDDIVARHNTLDVHANDGNGNFTLLSVTETGGFFYETLHLFDIDLDGNMDIVYRKDSQNTEFRLGNGDGTFQDPILLESEETVINVLNADFDQDGYQDIYMAAFDTILWYRNNQEGGFEEKQILITNDDFNSTVIALSDLNNDSITDILWLGRSTGDLAFQLGGDFLNTNSFEDDTLQFYPNPVDSVLFNPFKNSGFTEIKVYNSTGLLVIDQTVQQENIDFSHLPSGVYFINYKNQDVVRNQVIIKK